MEPRTLLSASLVADLNPAPFYGDIYYELAPVSGGAVFATREAATGLELYASDGTASGSHLLDDINPGPADSAPRYFTVSGSKVFFSADDGAHGRELWVTDGTASGTRIVTDLAPGGGSSDPTDLTDVNGILFFVANGQGGTGLYKTDGTAAGTTLVKTGVVLPFHTGAANVNGTLFFRGYDAQHGYELWKSDGTPAGTELVSDLTPGPQSSTFYQILGVNGAAYFAMGTKLYKSDGTAAGTVLVDDVPGVGSIADLASYNGLAVFHTSSGNGAAGLWRSDGTPQGTFKLHDVGTGYYPPNDLAVSGGAIYFGVHNSNGTAALWKSDGTIAGTVAVTSNLPGSYLAIQDLTDAGGTLYFAGDNGSLWKTNGTLAGSVRLGAAAVRAITPSGPHVFFRTTNSGGAPGLGVSDGTPAGTVFLKQFVAATQGSEIESLTSVGDKAFFTASGWAVQGGNPATEYGLYVTDGTSAGTTLLSPEPRYIADPLAFDGKLYFLTNGSLSVSDGTPGGTFSIKTFLVNQGPPVALTAVGNRLLFAEEGLWSSDGTPQGTTQLESVADPQLIAATATRAYFVGGDSSPQPTYSLWSTDGTAAGTAKISDLPIGFSDLPTGPATSITMVGDRVFFVLSMGSQDQLWTSDGTPAGTALVRTFQANFVHSTGIAVDNLVAMNGALYFRADDGNNDGLWRSDGTAAGTSRVAAFPPTYTPAVSHLTVFNNELFFAGYPPAGLGVVNTRNGVLWESDGTPAGTRPFPGLAADAMSDVRWVTSTGGKLFFENYTDRLNLWESDGTVEGTQVISSSQYPGQTSETPPVAVANGNIFFQSTDGAAGEALYEVPLDYTGPVAQIAPVASPRVGAVSATTITFNRPVTGLSMFNLSLTRGDSPNLLTSSQTLTSTDGGITWTLGNLDALTATAGDYVLTLHASDWLPGDISFSMGSADYPISDSADRPLMTSAEMRFSIVPTASIAGTVFSDANHNGQLDAGEPGLAGWTVFIDSDGNGVPDAGEISTTTDAAGAYVFSDLAPGSYVIREVVPSGWRRTTAGASQIVVAVAGQPSTVPTFGNVLISTVPMDFGYLLTLAQHYGQPGTFATGDVNDDGTVNFADLLLVAQNYGHPLP